MTTSDRVVRHPESDRTTKITVPENGDPSWDKAKGDPNSHNYVTNEVAEEKFKDEVLPKIPERPKDPTPTNANATASE